MDIKPFVRTEMIPEQAPPASQSGAVKWMRENLFSNAFNTFLTFVALYIIYKIIMFSFPWFANGLWTTSSLAECREILQGVTGGCFSVLTERTNQLLFGFKYSPDFYWRPTLAFIILIVAILPVLFQQIPRLAMNMLMGTIGAAVFLILTGSLTLIVPLFVLSGIAYLFLRKMFKATALMEDVAVPRALFGVTLLFPFVAFWLIWGGHNPHPDCCVIRCFCSICRLFHVSAR